MRKLVLLVLGLTLLFSQVLAQTQTISGRVTDDKGNPVPNASVLAKGTTTGTTTRQDGTFSLTVPTGTRALEVTSIGFDKLEVPISSGTTTINPQLFSNETIEREVVVVGYATQRKREVTAAISKVMGDEIANLPIQSLDRAIQGRAAGVAVIANNGIPGGPANVRIRGVGSISAGNDPLYIVDGVQMNSNTVSISTQTNPLAFLNSSDIESIEILKDAAASAIYGAKAGNGVVLITTKKGKIGRTNITANVYYGITSPLKTFDVLNSQEYFQARLEALMNGLGIGANTPSASLNGQTPRQRVLSEINQSPTLTDAEIAALPTYDWQDAAFGNGNVKNYELSLSGGNEKTRFYLSGGYNMVDAVVKPADYKKGNIFTKLNHKLNSKVSIETGISLSSIRQEAPFTTDGSFLGSPAFSSSLIIPTNPIYNADGSFYGLPGTGQLFGGILNNNVIAVGELQDAYQRTNQLVGNVSANWEIVRNLSLRGMVGLDYRHVHSDRYGDPRLNDYFNRRGLSQVATSWNTNFITNQVLTYITSIADVHNINAFVGLEYTNDQNENFSANGDGFPTPEFRNLGSSANAVSVGGNWTAAKTFSQFAKVTYDFRKRYILNASIRRDGSSRFGANKEYGYFPSVAAAWNVGQESFIKNKRNISDLKLRLSYGETGNDQFGNFASRSLYGANRVYNAQAGIGPTSLGNSDFGWEARQEVNFGIDFGFLGNRILGSFDMFKRTNKELLLNRPLYSTSGFTSFAQNVGQVQNNGTELSLTVKPFDGAFKWSTTFNITNIRNEVKQLLDTLKFLPTNNAIRIGESLGSIFTSRYAGVNPATGRAMWLDINGNITYNPLAADRVIIGDDLPEWYGGLSNTLSYKGFELDVFFNYEYGRLVSDGQVNFVSEVGGRSFNVLQDQFDRRWRNPGDITDVPRPVNNNAEIRASGNFTGSRTFLKADYIRLKQLTLSYNFPRTMLDRIKVNSAKFYVQGLNLWTYDDWPGYDPEFFGTATGIIPQSKNVTVGLQLGL